MNRLEAFQLVLTSLKKAANIEADGLSETTDLIKEGLIDSLDSMTLLFEVESTIGNRLEIDDEIDDFKISTMIDLIIKAVK